MIPLPIIITTFLIQVMCQIERQCMYNRTLRHIRATIVAVEK